jgi:hypothetical protein
VPAKLEGGSASAHVRHARVSTRCERETRVLGARSPLRGGGRAIDPAEEIAIVASARRELLLRVNGHRLYRAGVRPIAEILRENPLAQDYVGWGLPGPGRWVTIYATTSPTPHVFMTIAGLRLDTSHDGTDVGPNAREGGPRWRIFSEIPRWAHWSVRHPAGL